MRQGFIRRLCPNSPTKYGFIDGDEDYYFRASQLIPPLEFNEQLEQRDVVFEARRDHLGRPVAICVRAARP